MNHWMEIIHSFSVDSVSIIEIIPWFPWLFRISFCCTCSIFQTSYQKMKYDAKN